MDMFSKSREKALELKISGNVHFKEHDSVKALECYTKAITVAPFTVQQQQRFLESSLDVLKRLAPSKYKIAQSIYESDPTPESDSTYGTPDSAHRTSDPTPVDLLLSQCFGNKSAVLYEMEKYPECQFNIDQALSLDYPQASAHKLQRRRERCERKISGNNRPETLHPKEDVSAFQSDAICVSSGPELGRHMTAARDVAQGEVILSEDPYASVLEPSFVTSFCSYCFKHCPHTLLPCVLCAGEGYCSEECRLTAWTKYHWIECRSPEQWKKTANWMEKLCLRVVVSTDPADMLNACRGSDLKGTYKLIWNLLSHEDKYSDDDQKDALKRAARNLVRYFGTSILSYILPDSDCGAQHHSDLNTLPTSGDRRSQDLSTLPTSAEISADRPAAEHNSDLHTLPTSGALAPSPCPDPNCDDGTLVSEDQSSTISAEISATRPKHHTDLLALEGLFLHHLLQLRCNTHAVSQVLTGEEGEGCVLKESGEGVQPGGAVETVKEMRIGSVLLPTASLMNHSCTPNAIFRFTGNRVEVCVTEDLKSGDHIDNSYGPVVGRMKTAERKKELREKYFFDCQCPACKGYRSDGSLVLAEAAMDGLCCQKCNTGALAAAAVTATGESSMYICSHCHTQGTSTDISKQIKVKKKAEILFESATSGGRVCLESLLQVHKMQRQVLHRHNQELARTSDLIAQSYAQQGNFPLACKFLEQSCSSVGAMFGEHSIEFANELHKLASLFFHSGDMIRALETAKKAKSLFSIYFGQQHASYREMEDMVDFLNSNGRLL